MTLLIIAVVCGFIAGAINNSRGHSFWTGLILGGLMGPIGIILAVLTSRDEGALRVRNHTTELDLILRGEMRKCPFCAELVRPEATVCRYCGKDLPRPVNPRPATKAAPEWGSDQLPGAPGKLR
jgi:hypothetical protein